ncbi:hypothetical protein PTSG_07089 [Salpingoeca rosetta]|uniref:PDZ domain-containing protein n=1 Tax=Salpingoeca rosetta (strain ATCC 50818 / BSB-021) TaxID=946362 RepID=F2UE09_SALR5|nr:uncharacterized protein PTSG_07089 [Salpingoeca rosetta]EGD74859.1 hypothetical protein PTSG_07089 [Salpingoeca rosetta]|eukprot:XP_004992504.1 hypothetical protein PTSG_07089 [Salpingoeca rosetta]
MPPSPSRHRQEAVYAFHMACQQCIHPDQHQQLLEALQAFLRLRSFDKLAEVTLDVLPTRELRAQVIPPLLDLIPARDGVRLQSTLKRHLAQRLKASRGVGGMLGAIRPTTSQSSRVHTHDCADNGAGSGSPRRRGFSLSLGRRRRHQRGARGSTSTTASDRTSTLGSLGTSISSDSTVSRGRSYTLDSSASSRSKHTSTMRRLLSLSTSSRGTNGAPKPRRVKVQRDKYGTLGFNMRGGAEFGVGLYVSKVDNGGPAARAGVRIGDEIVSVNGTAVQGLKHKEAVQLFTGTKKLKLVVISTGRVPDKVNVQESFEWLQAAGVCDSVCLHKVATGPVPGTVHGPTDDLGDIELRRVNFQVGPKGIGMSICGGHDQGVGIYISAVDVDGIAAQHNLKPGDQLCDVNGVDFDLLTHAEAVKILTGSEHLFMTIKPGKYVPRHRYVMDTTEWIAVENNGNKNSSNSIGQSLRAMVRGGTTTTSTSSSSSASRIVTRTSSSSPSRTTALSCTGVTASPPLHSRAPHGNNGNLARVDGYEEGRGRGGVSNGIHRGGSGGGGGEWSNKSLRGGVDGQTHARPHQALMAQHLLSLGRETNVDAINTLRNGGIGHGGNGDGDGDDVRAGRPRSYTAPSSWHRYHDETELAAGPVTIPDANAQGRAAGTGVGDRGGGGGDGAGGNHPAVTANDPANHRANNSNHNSSINSHASGAGHDGCNTNTNSSATNNNSSATNNNNNTNSGAVDVEARAEEARRSFLQQQRESFYGFDSPPPPATTTAASRMSGNADAFDDSVVLRRNKPTFDRSSRALSTTSASSSLSFLDRTIAIAQEWASQAPTITEEDEVVEGEEEQGHGGTLGGATRDATERTGAQAGLSGGAPRSVDDLAHAQHGDGECDMRMLTVAKGSKPLGLVVAGGCDVAKTGGRVLVHKMTAGGAFAELGDEEVQVGDEVCLVNGRSLAGLTHKDAVQAIVAALQDTGTTSITFGLRRLASSDL